MAWGVISMKVFTLSVDKINELAETVERYKTGLAEIKALALMSYQYCSEHTGFYDEGCIKTLAGVIIEKIEKLEGTK